MASTTKIQRRKFLEIGSLALASCAVAIGTGSAGAAELPHVDEKDTTAVGLGYKHDATKVDKAKFPKHAAGQACVNCQLYQGKAADAWGGCPIFAGKAVNAKGWCSGYVKKA